MAIAAGLWTLNALSTELGIRYRTLGKKLSDLQPDAEEQQAGRVVRRWRLARVLRHLEAAGGNGAAQKPARPRSQYEAARTLREEYTAQLRRLEYERALGELIPAEEIVGAWQQLVAAVRSRMLSLPSKLGPRLVTMNETSAIQNALTAAVREALEELSRFSLPRTRGNGKSGNITVRDKAQKPSKEPVH